MSDLLEIIFKLAFQILFFFLFHQLKWQLWVERRLKTTLLFAVHEKACFRNLLTTGRSVCTLLFIWDRVRLNIPSGILTLLSIKINSEI